MRKTILTAACAALIGLGSIAAASAQNGTVNGAGNATGMSATDGNNMNSNAKMKKKKKMMKKGMMDDGKGTMAPGMEKGGMEKKM